MNTSQALPIHPTKRHPLTGQPIRALWVRPDGRTMWPIMGGAPDGGDGGASDGGAGDGGQGGNGAGEQGAGSGSGDGGNGAGQGGEQPPAKTDEKAAAQKVEDLPDWAQKLLKDTRDEAAKNRTGKTAAEEQQQKILKAVAQAAGLKIEGDDEQPDPAKLTEELTKSQQQAREAAVQLAVYKSASKNEGDPDALLDSNAFLASVKDLDPTAADFAGKVETAIKDAVKNNPKLKATQAAGSSSADHGAGGSGEKNTRAPKSLADAVGGHYGT